MPGRYNNVNGVQNDDDGCRLILFCDDMRTLYQVINHKHFRMLIGA